MFHTVKEVVPLDGYRLLVRFHSGDSRLYPLAPLMEKWESFRSLVQVAGLFQQVKMDPGGYGISWNDELDISCDELWHNGAAISTSNQAERSCIE